jgi:hypothetical protein
MSQERLTIKTNYKCVTNNNYKTFNLLYARFMYTKLQLKYMAFTTSMLNLNHMLKQTVKSTNNCGQA